MPIDYETMNRNFPKQKAALTRAVNSGDPEKVIATTRKTIAEWEAAGGAWPDDWARWQRALDDVLPWREQVDMNTLRAELVREASQLVLKAGKYRDLWDSNMPRLSGRMYFAMPGEQPIHVTDEQAYQILVMLSEEE